MYAGRRTYANGIRGKPRTRDCTAETNDIRLKASFRDFQATAETSGATGYSYSNELIYNYIQPKVYFSGTDVGKNTGTTFFVNFIIPADDDVQKTLKTAEFIPGGGHGKGGFK